VGTLGEILARIDDGADLSSLLAQIPNTDLVEKLEAHAAATEQQPAELARQAVRAFANGADDEAWLKLVGRVQDAPSPAAACLTEMLTWALKA
jgi:hypothetical protein